MKLQRRAEESISIAFLDVITCGIGAIILFVFCLMEGTRGPNEYGPDPKS